MSLVDPIATLINDFDLTAELGPLVVERRVAAGKNAFGAYEPAAGVPFNLSPWSAHDVSGRTLEQMPEADRNKGPVQFYARNGSFPGVVAKGFRVSDDGSDSDVMLYRGRRYRTTMVRDFDAQGRVWCAVAVLEDVQAIS